MRNVRPLSLLTLALMLAIPSVGGAQIQVLGNDGTIYRLLDDTYAAIFPEGTEAGPDSRVLALEITALDAEPRRLLVPETESRSAEVAPQLVYEQQGNALYLLWEGILGSIHPLLYLTTFEDGVWQSVIEITGNPFASKGHPQIVATRDLMRNGGNTRQVRTALHVVWWEETAGGTRKRYTPIIIHDGVHSDRNPTWDLSSFVEVVPLVAGAGNTELVHITAGPSNNSVLLGFLTTHGDRVITLEIDLLPAALSDLGDQIRFEIINSGLRTDLADLANATAAAILEAEGFHEGSLEHLAEQVHESVSTTRITLDGGGIEQLGDQIRFEIINSGARIATHGLASSEDFEIIEVERAEAPGTFDALKVSVVADRPAPADLGAGAEIFLSADGGHALLGWHEEDAYIYVESTADGWGEPRHLPTGESIDADAARKLLATLARGR